jgi:mannitol-specific phosphotransferase system IIBC component
MTSIDAADVHKVVIACDAGMGSSVMLASSVRKQLKKTAITVEHAPVAHIPDDADVILCHAGLAERTRSTVGDGRVVIPFQLFIGDPAVTRVVTALKSGGTIDG